MVFLIKSDPDYQSLSERLSQIATWEMAMQNLDVHVGNLMSVLLCYSLLVQEILSLSFNFLTWVT